MSDLIDREEVIDAICNKCMFDHKMERRMPIVCRNCRTVKMIQAIPSARPKGEWIVYEGGWKDLDYYPPKCKCNQCGYEEELYVLNAKPTNFCPNCGADMKGADDE